ncbi:MAG: DUF4003 family protein, partial [Clostridium sp.]|nr:DUF4003 family protein [Clostridium sp.]
IEKIKEVRKYLDSRKLPYPFKGVFNKICSIMLDDRDDYVQVFNNTLYVYERLIQNGFKGNEKAAFASLMLAKRFFGKELDNRINRIIDINSSLKDNDYISYANLSCTNRSVDRIRKELTEIENILKVTGRESSVDIKSFSTLLMIDEDNVETKVEKALNIMCNIKSELFEIPDKAYPLLGLATMLVEDPESFCVELKDIYNSLKNTKKYRYFMNRDLRIMISLGLLLNKYVEELKADLIDINVSDEINVFLALEECTVFSLSVI